MLDISLQTNLLEEYQATRIIGIDEVGRGAWAGPVVIGAFAWQPDMAVIETIRDSKLIKQPERERLFTELGQHFHKFASSDACDVDEKGITRCIEANIASLIGELDDGNTLFIVDGYFKFLPETKIFQAPKADNTYYAVAAAAILAKVYRDNLMAKFAEEFQGYGWESNKGYGTASHTQAIRERGITPLHRKSFVPKELIV